MADEQKISNTTEEVKKNSVIAKFARLIVLGGAALIVFVIFFVRFMVTESKNNTYYAPDIVIMGDSIFAYALFGPSDSTVAGYLEKKMNVTVADASFGGTCMSYIDKDGRLDTSNDAYCMAALTQAIVAQDFRYQDNSDIRLTATDYFEERLEMLKSIDFSQVDILIMDYLLNDYQIAVPVSCGSDKYDEYTYEGAMRSVVTQLKDKYPELRIIVVAPVKSWYTDDSIPSDEMDLGGGTVDVYIECQKMLAEELGVEWISLYDIYDEFVAENPDMIVDENGESISMIKFFTDDQVHPRIVTRELIADRLCEYLTNGE